MDFIERLFGISPDGGSGAFELLLFLLPIMGIAIIARRWYARAGRRGDIGLSGKRDTDAE
jgi:hypothetical protein